MKNYLAYSVVLLICMQTFFNLNSRNPLLTAQSAYAEDDWKTEFDDLCSKTQDAMLFTEDQLKSLVERCDRLKQRIETLDESQKKVYLKRLSMCRDLFAYMLKSKQK